MSKLKIVAIALTITSASTATALLWPTKHSSAYHAPQWVINEAIKDGRMQHGPPPTASQLRFLATTEAASPVPPGVILHFPTYVRLLAGCTWVNSLHSLTITRHVNQGFDFVNLGVADHQLIEQVSDSLRIPQTITPSQHATGSIFSTAGTYKFSTCSGKTLLTVKVS